MATGFSAADFDIVPDGDQLPMPVEDEQGFTRYSCTVMLPSRTQYNTLASYKSLVDIVPALGGGGLVIVKSGVGKRTLTYPQQNGTEVTATAILTSLQGQVRMLNSGYITAQAEWTFTS